MSDRARPGVLDGRLDERSHAGNVDRLEWTAVEDALLDVASKEGALDVVP